MSIYLYNSLSGKKEIFQPISPQKLKMYVCGMTVYDDCHIGHARTQIAFDVIVRYFRFCNYDVTYVRNITDIDDKIIKRANENGESTDALVERTIKSMYDDLDRLNILRPDFDPRATQTIPEMCQMIENLIAKGFAYAPGNGDVYYRVEEFKDYGKLSKQSLEHLRVGARIESNEQKENPLDFVLWKAAKAGEPSWESPWGQGRPGWHIECSAMSKKLLGDNFDIHAGGSDLRFPHHENEIAQSEAANGCSFANYWLHSGMVQVDDEKMSKSLNNFFTIKEVLSEYHPEVVRFFLISGQYRSEINYSKENLDQAKAAIERLYTALRGLEITENTVEVEEAAQYVNDFKQAMNNDFNTPEALPVLFAIAKEINKYRTSDQQKAAGFAKLLLELANVLGILKHSPESYFKHSGDNDLSDEVIETMIAERTQAKKNKDYAKADQIRQTLAEQGVLLEDSATGTIWKRA
ncbi:cysteine--tRNA ligase [Cysteiniphilum sp. QT6929]|uniref:cysteine--tRNA ligase n=1 Tax=Cysteiniphilum sp. QT6929 TaxID=2975055 RepID=UPI0024B325B2|nr:cysteine--tRNA ligase [Cysteiniphilum sp. QT6929]WHN64959.1 cysteine--tRNA ligase [Cysteiniphilum sp. QT6929]